ncbi:hypothetical protein A6A29_38220 [Streptomyces sp. TSRI0281]|nr:hypothetical protein A6A29_38220 [Streptomyces sp. TSRI0281]
MQAHSCEVVEVVERAQERGYGGEGQGATRCGSPSSPPGTPEGRFQDWAEEGAKDSCTARPAPCRPGSTGGAGRTTTTCGHLGFTFWGWAELTSDFTGEVGLRLGGHRTVLLAGKL